MTDCLGSKPRFSVVRFMYHLIAARDFRGTWHVIVCNRRLYNLMQIHVSISSLKIHIRCSPDTYFMVQILTL